MKVSVKRNVLLMSVLMLFSVNAFAESPVCGEAQDASWMEPEVMQEQLESLGYTIESMNVSTGNCYEVTGLNVEGDNITAYLDPRTGSVVQEDKAE